MKRLIDLKIRDRFRFPEEDEIYVFSYEVSENQVAIIAEEDLGKEGKIKRVSANSEIIPEKGNRPSKPFITIRKRSELFKRRNAWYSRKTRLSDILLAGIVLLVIYSVFFVHIFK